MDPPGGRSFFLCARVNSSLLSEHRKDLFADCTLSGEDRSCVFPLVLAEKETATLLSPLFLENKVAFVLAGSIIHGAMRLVPGPLLVATTVAGPDLHCGPIGSTSTGHIETEA